jgi:hypothetical protein
MQVSPAASRAVGSEKAGVGPLDRGGHADRCGVSLRSDRSPCQLQVTRVAPCCSRQSENPPVDVPTSRQARPLTAICQWARGAGQLESATADVGHVVAQEAQRRHRAATNVPGLSTFCSLTRTRPARM